FSRISRVSISYSRLALQVVILPAHQNKKGHTRRRTLRIEEDRTATPVPSFDVTVVDPDHIGKYLNDV
ncbi:MAG: hypothetical protein ACTSRV_14855, partial [Candidatus Freyarchaeota archaeon]